MIKVLKFGGSVLKNANDIKNIKSIIDSDVLKKNHVIVVMSAFNGITNNLLELAKSISSYDGIVKFKTKIDAQQQYVKNIATTKKEESDENNNRYEILYNSIVDSHLSIAKDLKINENGLNEINELLLKMQHTIIALSDKKKMINELQDSLLSYGERLSSLIFYLFLRDSVGSDKQCKNNYYYTNNRNINNNIVTDNNDCHHVTKNTDVKYIESCKIIVTDSNFGHAKVDFEKSNKLIKKAILNYTNNSIDAKIVVCAGFIGEDNNGRITTLGRNGSDYTASIIASAVKADSLEIWKDTDGLYTADPKIVKNVKFIKKITYQEMAELSSLGNKVVHVDAISPCVQSNIPIFLKNCYKKRSKGTLISKNKCKNYLINGIVKLDNVIILTLSLNDFMNATAFAIDMQKIMQNFEDIIITVSQNIKQRIFSIIVVNTTCTDKFIKEIENKFNKYMKDKDLLIHSSESKSMITIIGADFSKTTGISGKIFSILNDNRININAIHDDFSSTRISFLCKTTEANKVVNMLHKNLIGC